MVGSLVNKANVLGSSSTTVELKFLALKTKITHIEAQCYCNDDSG